MLLEAEKLDEKRWPARVFAMILDGWKNRGLTPDQVPAGEAASFANGKGKKLYVAYQERLKTLNAADFGDLLLENIRLFRAEPGRAAAVPAALQIHPGGRVSGHQRGAVFVAAVVVAAAPSITSPLPETRREASECAGPVTSREPLAHSRSRETVARALRTQLRPRR